MKRVILAIASAIAMSSSVYAQYLSAALVTAYLYGCVALGVQQNQVDTAGLNTAGSFVNFECNNGCQDDYGSWSGSAFIGIGGIELESELASLRFEIEYYTRDSDNVTTGSFPGLNPATFFYNTQIDRAHAGFVNAYLDITVPNSNWTVSVGGGIGAGFTDISTNDAIVFGSVSDTNFAWNAGGGASYAITERISIFGDVRYIDLGETNTNLTQASNSAPAGRYIFDNRSVEARVGIRFRFN